MPQPKEEWEKRFIKEFVNDHGTEWRPLRGLWVEDVLAFEFEHHKIAMRDIKAFSIYKHQTYDR